MCRRRAKDLYRRSLYTYWKRTVPPPFMMNFDSPNREQCAVFENRTNSPLQALDLMNDVTFLEASRKLAERMMTEGGRDSAGAARVWVRAGAGAQPDRPAEANCCSARSAQFEQSYRADVKAAAEFIHQGDSPVGAGLDPAELAAYTGVASLILNLDETITKE